MRKLYVYVGLEGQTRPQNDVPENKKGMTYSRPERYVIRRQPIQTNAIIEENNRIN